MERKKTAIVSGYFDPLHVGHIEYFKLAKEMATLPMYQFGFNTRYTDTL